MSLKLKFGILFIFFVQGLFGQEFRVCPKFNAYIEWKSPVTYREQNDTARALLRWLCQTPFSDQVVERSKASLFVMQWAAGHPDYTFKVDEEFCFGPKLYTEELYLAYLFGNMQSQLKKGSFQSQPEAGLEVVAELSSFSKVYSKDRFIHELQKASRKKELSEFYLKYCNYKH
jgi:hypothetical protein